MTRILTPPYITSTPSLTGRLHCDEKALLEPNLLIPYKKPVGSVVVNKSHPLVRGMKNLYFPQKTALDPCLITGEKLLTAAALKIGTWGVGGTANGSEEYITISPSYLPGPMTLFGVVNGYCTGTVAFGPLYLGNGTTFRRFAFSIKNLAVDWFGYRIAASGSITYEESQTGITDSENLFIIVLTRYGNTGHYFYRHSPFDTQWSIEHSDTSTSVDYTGYPMDRFYPITEDSVYYPSEVLMSGWSTRYWSPSEARSFIRDPYQFLEPA